MSSMPWRNSSSRRNKGLAGGLDSTMRTTNIGLRRFSKLNDYRGDALRCHPIEAMLRAALRSRHILSCDGLRESQEFRHADRPSPGQIAVRADRLALRGTRHRLRIEALRARSHHHARAA